jgi:hypothetical protein
VESHSAFKAPTLGEVQSQVSTAVFGCVTKSLPPKVAVSLGAFGMIDSLPLTQTKNTNRAPENSPSAPSTTNEFFALQSPIDFGGSSTTEAVNQDRNLSLGKAVQSVSSADRESMSEREISQFCFTPPATYNPGIIYPDHEIAGIILTQHLSPRTSSICHGNAPNPAYALHVPTPLSYLDEAKLVRSFSENMGKWIDLSDLRKTFSKQVPYLGLRDNLIRDCIIACSAKHLALVHSSEALMQVALRYYDSAISTLINRLSNESEAKSKHTFVATVIFSAYEMLDATGTEWKNHLKGIVQMGRVTAVSGSCGGVEQAGFWCFARQETVCSILNKSKLRVDPDTWGIDLSNVGRAGKEDLVNCQYAVLSIYQKSNLHGIIC